MNALEARRAKWRKTGCTIMIDGWTDKRRRMIINFLVNNPKGTIFLKSIDASTILKTVEKTFEMMDGIVEEVGEDNVVQVVIDNAANYKAVEGRDLVRLGITRFATSYLIGCLHENMGALIRMFTSNEWKSSRFAKTKDGKLVEDVGGCPLIEVLRLVNLDKKPAMGFIYEAIDQAKEKIPNAFNDVKKSYLPLWNIIDERWDKQHHRPLHAAGYFLNPELHYRPGFKADLEVKRGLFYCLTRMVKDPNKQNLIDVQVDDFMKQAKFFVVPWPPAPLDVTIIGVSSFEMVHAKRRNRLKQNTMNDVVFVMANSKLAKKKQTRKPVELILDDYPFDDEWIMEDEHRVGENEGLGLDVDNLDLDENLVLVQIGEDEETTVTTPLPLDDLDITNLNGEEDGIGKDGVEDLLSNYDFNLQDYILYRFGNNPSPSGSLGSSLGKKVVHIILPDVQSQSIIIAYIQLVCRERGTDVVGENRGFSV
ncbi:hypothetical protein CR513_49209, partial [Mucuna pruriens]